MLDEPLAVGAVSQGSTLVHLGFAQNKGFLRSEPDYAVKVDAVFAHGADYIKVDPDGKHARLDVQSVLKEKSTGSLIRYNYVGTIALSGPAGKVLRGDADAKTTGFGEAFTQVVFETGSAELRELQNKTYVASGRFIIEAGQPVVVEYKISEVAN